MVRDVITVKPNDKVADAIELLSTYDISALPVVDDMKKSLAFYAKNLPSQESLTLKMWPDNGVVRY